MAEKTDPPGEKTEKGAELANGVRASEGAEEETSAVAEALENPVVVDLGARRKASRGAGDPLGYDPEALNEIYALVLVGGKAAVLEENFKRPSDLDIPLSDRVRFIGLDAFMAWHANETVTFDNKQISVARLWMADARRRQYRGIVFDPEDTPENYYNLWRGFSHAPDPSERARRKCAIFLDHVKTNIAQGDEENFKYIMAWAAHMIQRPKERAGISLVFRGKMGTGKTIYGEVIGALIDNHYLLVDDPRYIVGNFNAHMASLLLLQADEGFWAGDKQAEGRLKGLVTSKRQMIEMKGKDPVYVDNYVHLLVTSNHEWVVPAGHKERRFAIFDVGEGCMQNREYFGEMLADLKDGGYGGLLHYLLNFDLSSVDLWKIPKTEALLEQKLASLPPVEAWWFECLRRGYVAKAGDDTWPDRLVTQAVYDSFTTFCDQVGVRHRQTPEQLGTALRKLAPGLFRRRIRLESGERPYAYAFPYLHVCRAAFAKEIGGEDIEWEDRELEQRDDDLG